MCLVEGSFIRSRKLHDNKVPFFPVYCPCVWPFALYPPFSVSFLHFQLHVSQFISRPLPLLNLLLWLRKAAKTINRLLYTGVEMVERNRIEFVHPGTACRKE